MTTYPEYKSVRTICVRRLRHDRRFVVCLVSGQGFPRAGVRCGRRGRSEILTEYVSRAWIALQQTCAGSGTIADALARLSFHSDLHEALSGADFVQENLPEKLNLKQEVLRRLDEHLPTEVVIASSTSGIRASLLQAHMSAGASGWWWAIPSTRRTSSPSSRSSVERPPSERPWNGHWVSIGLSGRFPFTCARRWTAISRRACRWRSGAKPFT